MLYVHPAQIHGSEVTWANDPTFDPAYAGNIGANEPMLTAGYMDAAAYGGPAHRLQPGADYATYRVLELFSDSVEPERKGLSRRKMTRMLAPQTSEAPLFFHLTDSSSTAFRHAIDQMHSVGGFDMLIYSFGCDLHCSEQPLSLMRFHALTVARRCAALGSSWRIRILPTSRV